MQHPLVVLLPVTGRTGLVLPVAIIVVVELREERVPCFVALVEQLVGDGTTNRGSEAVADLGFGDGVPDVVPRLVGVEVCLAAVVGDDVDEGGRRVEEFDQAHLLPLAIGGESEGVGARAFFLGLGRHRRVMSYVRLKHKGCGRAGVYSDGTSTWRYG
ncbi:hypothetical protein [Halorientalis regularis]|uniref:hypothetical protein n=1 Tax=Halorientalis regularis TaxID=660518 RepID=UPI002032C8E3|nr:hypothetical protein [Halorientalis regularis]